MAISKPLRRLLLVLALAFTYVVYDFASEYYAAQSADASAESGVEAFFSARRHARQGHTNNWAVLVCSSRYWFNYRHMANALGMYRTVKRLGIPDSNIILMLADDAACNSRNKFPGSVYANKGRGLDLYGDNIEVDYRGYEVTVENFIRVLTGRVADSVPRSKRLLTDDRSNIFLYMTGHGGNEFLKFQDNEEISAFDLADAIEQMWQKKRYNEIFFMIDTCQANTMYSKLYSPNILATGSAQLNENSYSHENDQDIGVAVIDSFTHHSLQYLEGVNKTTRKTMDDFFSTYSYDRIKSTAGVRTDLFYRRLNETLLTDFFGGVAQVESVEDIPNSDDTRTASGSQIPLNAESSTTHHVKDNREASSMADAPELNPTGTSPSPSNLNRRKSQLQKVQKPSSMDDWRRGMKLWGASAVIGGLLLWALRS
ncbi:glycosylphosphatidylinositol anchor biosynthesis [Tulasnella sp. 330]|nr:glycosylphosphatidylinositol anchor biosynthesis [Tulasnella sp. 330]